MPGNDDDEDYNGEGELCLARFVPRGAYKYRWGDKVLGPINSCVRERAEPPIKNNKLAKNGNHFELVAKEAAKNATPPPKWEISLDSGSENVFRVYRDDKGERDVLFEREQHAGLFTFHLGPDSSSFTQLWRFSRRLLVAPIFGVSHQDDNRHSSSLH